MVTITIMPTMATMDNTMPSMLPTPLMVLTTLSLMVHIMHNLNLMLKPTMLNIQLSTTLNL